MESALLFRFFSVFFASIGIATLTFGKDCGSPPVPHNAKVLTASSTEPSSSSNGTFSPGFSIRYSCDPGYELFGEDTLKCSDIGLWPGDLPFCAVNVAYRKPVNQSTTVRGGDASHANDGSVNTLHEGKHCTETRKEASPWWRVDLLRSYDVRVIRIFSASGGQHPLQDIEIRVGNSTVVSRNRLCAWNPGTLGDGVKKDFLCAGASTGRYVFLQMVGVEGALSICEIQVFTTQELSPERCSTSKSGDFVQSFNQICYDFQLKRGSDFQGAQKHCHSLGGELVHDIDNVTKNFLVGELEMVRPSMTTPLVWIGAVKDPGITARVWHWVGGTVVAEPMWGPDQPNNYNGEQNCVVLDGGRGWLWNDVGCNLNYLLWVCQYEPPSCGSPDVNVNTTILNIGTDFTVGQVIRYECPSDSYVVGNGTRECLRDGVWSGLAPICRYVDCGLLPSIANGQLQLLDNRTTHGARASYVCHENYTRSGSEVQSCGQDGRWTGDSVACLYKFCPSLDVPRNGSVKFTNGLTSGSVANFSCERGHRMVGDALLTCQVGGRWTGTPPQCLLTVCPEPQPLTNGVYVLPQNSTLYGSEVVYLCDEDHILDGPNRRSCTGNGTWSDRTPFCEIITCEQPEVRPNSFVVADNFNVGSLVEYHCDPGHVLEGRANLTCGFDGKWSGDAPRCRFVECGHVQPVLHGQVDYINLTTHLNSIVSYTCAPGYRLNGNGTRVCEIPGRWSGSTPFCEEIRCNEPERPPNSVLSVSGNDRSGDGDTFKVGSSVQFRCEKGYKGHGDMTLVCERDGQWRGEPAICLYVDCLYPEPLLNGEVSLLSNTTYYGSTAEYVCDDRYELVGLVRRPCLENGTWEGTAPHCREINCGPPDKPQSVTAVDVANSTVDAIAVYRCSPGQRITGNGTRVCLRNGRWSATAPTCDWVDCGRPVSPQNGEIYLLNQSTTYMSFLEYHCFFGYKLVGPAVRTCCEDGKWSAEDARCELDTSNTDVIGDNSLTKPIASVGEETDGDIIMSKTIGLAIGIGAGGILLLTIIIALVYMKLRRPKPSLVQDETLHVRQPFNGSSNGNGTTTTTTAITNQAYVHMETDLSDRNLMTALGQRPIHSRSP